MKKLITLLFVLFSFQSIWAKLELKALPYAYYGTDVGLGFGAFTYLVSRDINTNELWNFYIELNYSTMGEHHHKFIFKIPSTGINGLPLDYTIRFIYDKVPRENYFGLGNDKTIIEDYTNYYKFHRITPNFSAYAEASFFKTSWNYPYLLKGLFSLNAEVYTILPTDSLPTNGTNFLFIDNPRGIGGGWALYPFLGISFDGRDNPFSTRMGTYHEIGLELSSSALGSTYDYTRFTFINSGFLPLHKTLVLAERFIWDVLWGDVPFFKTFRYGGLVPREAIGGRYSVRGIPFYRYSDNVKLINNLELRWTPIRFPFLGEEWKIGFSLFWDSGKVWSKVGEMDLSEFQHTYGMSLRVHWGNNFVGGADIGFWNGKFGSFYVEVTEIF